MLFSPIRAIKRYLNHTEYGTTLIVVTFLSPLTKWRIVLEGKLYPGFVASSLAQIVHSWMMTMWL